jgi:hypothetical protein
MMRLEPRAETHEVDEVAANTERNLPERKLVEHEKEQVEDDDGLKAVEGETSCEIRSQPRAAPVVLLCLARRCYLELVSRWPRDVRRWTAGQSSWPAWCAPR